MNTFSGAVSVIDVLKRGEGYRSWSKSHGPESIPNERSPEIKALEALIVGESAFWRTPTRMPRTAMPEPPACPMWRFHPAFAMQSTVMPAMISISGESPKMTTSTSVFGNVDKSFVSCCCCVGVNVRSASLASSGLRHAECRLSSAARARFTFSRMSAAFAVQMNGLGFLLC
jgi:hypothetical protein